MRANRKPPFMPQVGTAPPMGERYVLHRVADNGRSMRLAICVDAAEMVRVLDERYAVRTQAGDLERLEPEGEPLVLPGARPRSTLQVHRANRARYEREFR